MVTTLSVGMLTWIGLIVAVIAIVAAVILKKRA